MANSKKRPYIVIAEYIDKNTGKRHVVGDEVKLTDKRAEEILSNPRPLIRALDEPIVSDGIDGADEAPGESDEEQACEEEQAYAEERAGGDDDE